MVGLVNFAGCRARHAEMVKRSSSLGTFKAMRISSVLLLICFVAMATAAARGHEANGQAHDNPDTASHALIKTSGEKRIIEANGLPDHQPGQFPNRGNPNSISAQRYRFEMPLKSRASDEP